MTLLPKNIFRFTLLGIILIELFSFYSWYKPEYNSWFFLSLVLLTFILSLKDLKIGVGIVLSELIIGSFGYLFFYPLGEFNLSFRLGLFTAVFLATIYHALKEKRVDFLGSQYFKPFLVLVGALVYAFLSGILQNNGFKQVFLDANGFLFLGFVFPLWQAVKSQEDIKLIAQALSAAIVVGVAKVLLMLYLFSHHVGWIRDVYLWVRDTKVGEITQFQESFFRIFFQSQIFHLVAFLIILSTFILVREKLNKKYYILIIFLASSIILSLSRSIWVGLVVALLLLPIFVYFKNKERFLKRLFEGGAITTVSFVLGFLVIGGIIFFPYPNSSSFNAGSLISSRLELDDAAVGSRWALLNPLWDEVKSSWLLGSGFGEEVTYFSKDPRVLEKNPTGEFTTFTFEWGYLDLWLKFGVIGGLGLIYFLFYCIKSQLYIFKQSDPFMFGTFLSVIALFAIHFFTPYLNHPLGWGLILWWLLLIDMHNNLIDKPLKQA